MLLLFDIGNTHTHIGLANADRVIRQTDFKTELWTTGGAEKCINRFTGRNRLKGVALCSVVPGITPSARRLARDVLELPIVELSPATIAHIGIDYPKPESIGPDRLANSMAVKFHFGSPAVVVDFGTAVTFDVVNARGDYIGGIITPGLAAMTDYLHEKTALLPKIEIREINKIVGKNTREAMLIGAVHGYRGLIKELLGSLKSELKAKHLPVVATGGYARLMAGKLPEITAVDPKLTLEGLRLMWEANRKA
jgi:type III pantothenate kinase